MKKMLVFLLCLLVLCLMAVPGASAADISVRDEFAAHFAGFTGTFVMYDPAGDKYIVYNEPQKQKRLSPCSHLQNLQLAHRPGNRRIGPGRCIHAVQMERDGPLYWNHDHTASTTDRWYSVELAHRPGTDQEYIDKIGGNKVVPDHLLARLSSADFALEQVDSYQQAYIRGNCRSAANTAILQRTSLSFRRTAAPS